MYKFLISIHELFAGFPPHPAEEGSDGVALVAPGVLSGPAQRNLGDSRSMDTNGHSAWEAQVIFPILAPTTETQCFQAQQCM